MVKPPIEPPIWVDTYADLNRMLRDLDHYDILAVDTESNSLFAYREQVCLVQISTLESDYLIDTLALADLAGLAPVFANPKVEKVFHAGEYDVMCLKRDHGFAFSNLFDTMIASRILGRKEVGLASLLNAEFGIEINKTYQRANWGKRPLPPEYIHYARLDSRYLIALRQRMMSALRASERLELALEDFARLGETRPAEDQRELDCWRVSGSQDLSPQQMAVLQALCEYREMQAELRDLPPFKVLQNSVLVGVAAACPQNKAELEQLRLMNQRTLDQHFRGLLESVRHGLQSPPPVRSRTPRPSDAFLTRLEALRTWRKKTAAGLGVESDVVLPRDIMEALAGAAPESSAELKKIMVTVPWRQDRFGTAILEITAPHAVVANNHL